MDHKNPGRIELFTPGPVTPPSYVTQAMSRAIVHHRSPAFGKVYSELASGIGTALESKATVLVLASSATGAMDAVVSSLFAEGDEVLVPVMGKFSSRWAEICRVYGVKPHVMEIAPGLSPAPEAVADMLWRNEQIAGLLLTHSETSTGSLTDLKGVLETVRGLEAGGRRILNCADCVSSFCVDELRMDPWGLDCVISASQKGLLSPAGLSFVCLGERAQRALARSPARNYYLNLADYVACAARAETPFTPAVSLMYAVGAALERILDIGLNEVWDWGASSANAIRHVLEAAGFEPLAANQSSAVVAFWVGDMDAEGIAACLENEHNIYLARGQGDLRGRILRISPIGKTRGELLYLFEALLETVGKMGRRVNIEEARDSGGGFLKGSDIWA